MTLLHNVACNTMKSPSTFSDVINLWPSRTALAGDIGLEDANLVRSWRSRDRIPDEYWAAIVKAAGERGFSKVTPHLLTALAATKRAA